VFKVSEDNHHVLSRHAVKQELLDARLALINTQLASHVNLTEIERLTGLAISAQTFSADSKEQK
jgi:cobalt-zinc-cadmium efflux system outer membrane protein